MDEQLSFASLEFAGKKRTKRDVFLAEMAAAVPWSVLEALIEPHYPKVGPGRRPFAITVMLRIYCLQQWYQLSDPGAEEALYDIQSMRAFCNLELGRDPISTRDPFSSCLSYLTNFEIGTIKLRFCPGSSCIDRAGFRRDQNQ